MPTNTMSRLLFAILMAAALLASQQDLLTWSAHPAPHKAAPPVHIQLLICGITLIIGFVLWPILNRKESAAEPWIASSLRGTVAGLIGTICVFTVFGLYFIVGAGAHMFAEARDGADVAVTPFVLIFSLIMGGLFILLPALPYGAVAGLLTSLVVRASGHLTRRST